MVTQWIFGRIPLINNLKIANNLLWTTKDAFNNVGYITACRNDANASLYRCIRSKPMHIKFERKKGIITQSLEGMLDYKVLKWNCCIKERLPRRNILLKRPNNNYLDSRYNEHTRRSRMDITLYKLCRC